MPSRVVQRDVGDVGPEHGADLLADEVEQLGESSLPASCCDTVLMVASSAARRCASSNSRAFSIATVACSDRPTRNSSSVSSNGRAARSPHRHRAPDRLAGQQRRHHQPLVARRSVPGIWTPAGRRRCR